MVFNRSGEVDENPPEISGFRVVVVVKSISPGKDEVLQCFGPIRFANVQDRYIPEL